MLTELACLLKWKDVKGNCHVCLEVLSHHLSGVIEDKYGTPQPEESKFRTRSWPGNICIKVRRFNDVAALFTPNISKFITTLLNIRNAIPYKNDYIIDINAPQLNSGILTSVEHFNTAPSFSSANIDFAPTGLKFMEIIGLQINAKMWHIFQMK